MSTTLNEAAGIAAFCNCHVAPFHSSTSGAAFPDDEGVVPTAVQAVADVQETEFSVDPAGAGVVLTVHAAPFQFSIQALDPRAVHQLVDAHETAATFGSGPGFGVVWRVHAEPSQCSASVIVPPWGVAIQPTAVQVLASEQDTLFRALDNVPPGAGTLCGVQLPPLNCSTSSTGVPPLIATYPTAVHTVADAHDTPLNALKAVPPGLAIVCIVQLVPSQASASVLCTLALVSKKPTATHAVDDVHETALNALAGEPPGFGTVCRVQPAPAHVYATGISPAVPEPNENPTAIHDVVVAHETPVSSVSIAPDGLAMLSFVQPVPFQLSASGSFTVPESTCQPTATQAVADAHDTAWRLADLAPAAPANSSTQDAPFHRSTSGPLPDEPTAVHEEAEVHDTPVRSGPRPGEEAVSFTQLVPFHPSITIAPL